MELLEHGMNGTRATNNFFPTWLIYVLPISTFVYIINWFRWSLLINPSCVVAALKTWTLKFMGNCQKLRRGDESTNSSDGGRVSEETLPADDGEKQKMSYSIGCKSALKVDGFPPFVTSIFPVDVEWQLELFSMSENLGINRHRRRVKRRSFSVPFTKDDVEYLVRWSDKTRGNVFVIDSSLIELNNKFAQFIDEQIESLRKNILYPIKLRAELKRIEICFRKCQRSDNELYVRHKNIGKFSFPVYSAERIMEEGVREHSPVSLVMRDSLVVPDRSLSASSARTASTQDPESPQTLQKTAAPDMITDKVEEVIVLFDVLSADRSIDKEMKEVYRDKIRGLINEIMKTGVTRAGVMFSSWNPGVPGSSPGTFDILMLDLLEEIVGGGNLRIQTLCLSKEGWCLLETVQLLTHQDPDIFGDAGFKVTDSSGFSSQIKSHVDSIVQYQGEGSGEKGKLGIRVISEDHEFCPALSNGFISVPEKHRMGNVMLIESDLGKPALHRLSNVNKMVRRKNDPSCVVQPVVDETFSRLDESFLLGFR